MNIMQALQGFLSRKFILAVLMVVVVSVFLKDVGGDAKLTFFEWLFGLYAGANVAQKATANMPTEPETTTA